MRALVGMGDGQPLMFQLESIEWQVAIEKLDHGGWRIRLFGVVGDHQPRCDVTIVRNRRHRGFQCRLSQFVQALIGGHLCN